MEEVKRMSLDGAITVGDTFGSSEQKKKISGKYGNKTAGVEDIIMGIDLGTTNSAVAVYTGSMVPTLCPLNAEGKVTMPSCVRWDRPEMDGCKPWTVGEEAYQERFMPDVCYSIKRAMGSGTKFRFVDRNDSKHVLDLTPAEISSLILGELKSRVNKSYPGLNRCIITVPAYFNQRQIEDTIEAARLAELDCIQILKEPTSASYIYSQLGYAQDGSILVYDLGGGTFDVTHMSFLRKSAIPKKMYTELRKMYGIDLSGDDDGDAPFYCRVQGTYGDVNLGGDDIDRAMANLVVEAQPDLNLSEREFEELVLRCEQFKKSGVRGQDACIGNDKICKLNEGLLEQAIKSVFDRTMEIVRQIPAEELEAIKTVVLVGGSTKSDYLVNLLSKELPGKEISKVLDPDATVALGAGAVAKDVAQGRGAAYQDVLPMMIGVLTNESEVDVVIPKNTPMPHSVTRQYHTLHDGQTAVRVDVYQGVSKNPKECTYLGQLRVTGLEPKPAGEVNVVVYMMLNSKGRLVITTVVDGVAEEHQLVIDSIYGVGDDTGNVTSVATQAQDEFEEAFLDMCLGNKKLEKLIERRREAKSKDDVDAVLAFEAEIVGAL